MKAVILAGGLGLRLRPFTELIPKPLLPVGESSVLDIQIRRLAGCGFNKIFIATNYLSEQIEEHVGDGSQYGIDIQVSREPMPLGTCGPVTLLRRQLKEPYLLMNGDILTTLDFRQPYDVACGLDADLTVVTKQVVTPFAFGQVLGEGSYVAGVQEKPDLRFEILAGIYVLRPALFDVIPRDTYYGIDGLIKDLLGAGRKVGKYVCRDFWLDIGQMEDYRRAHGSYLAHFTEAKDRCLAKTPSVTSE